MLLADILPKLQKPKKLADGSYLAICPAHQDRVPSLHLTQAKDTVLIKCQAGCQTEAVITALGMTMAELFPPSKKIVATYDYQDETGNLLFQVVRYEPKSFAQRHKNGQGEWVWNMEGVRRVIYHLPEILIENGTIHFVEGEKDADSLWQWGQVATTSPGGANAWQSEYADFFKGKRVVIIPDKDGAGYTYARQVTRSLQGKAREVKCIILPGENIKDFSDWLEAGNNITELPLLEQDVSVLLDPIKPQYEQKEDSITWQKGLLVFKAESVHQERTGIHARISIEFEEQPLAWSLFNIEKSEDRTRLANSAHANLKDSNKDDLRRDLDIFCAGLWDFYLSTFTPELMKGDEAQTPPRFYLEPYIIEGGGSLLFSPPGKGKSNTALLWAQSINCGVSKLFKVEKVPVLYINLERSGQSLKRRLAGINIVLGLPASQTLLTLNARGKSLATLAPSIRKAIKQYGVKLIILDSISRAGYGKLTEDAPVNIIIDTLSGLSESWLALAHSPRASEEHLYGSIMFDAGADIVIQLRSQVSENKLGIGYEITKSNDLPQFKQKVYAFEFEDWRLINVRPATPFEFPDIEAKKKVNMLEAIIDFISNQDNGDASATEIAKEMGYNRANVSNFLSKSDKFVKTRKVKTSQFYGVKSNQLL